jgi:DNA-directed RNA polymerase subunit F
MIGEKVLEQKPITLAEVKQLLSERKKDKDLSYEQDITLKYAKKFSKLSQAQAEKLVSELKGIGNLDDETVVKIADFLPVKKEILQLLIPKEVVLDEASMQKIIDLCKKLNK